MSNRFACAGIKNFKSGLNVNFQMLVKVVLLMSLFGLGSCKTTKKQEDSVSQGVDARTHQSSLDVPLLDFFMASFLIREIFDRNSNICNTPSEQIFVLPQQMKILVDQRFPKERLQYQKMDAISKKNYWPSDCALSCSCSGYILLLEFFKENGVIWTDRAESIYAP